ncbi:dipeptide epimerase [uncultured Pontibacter sp.]|uniref:dipeptide epimerase n=1 Tax=uncultured Pontibacter sp. TaxID=453356 RepID=UPI002626DED8|nr:dipeptide epimerase [uncultured Pontibacter sp.]
MKLTIRSFALPLRHTFTISYDSRDVQDTLIVELQDGEYKGYGEATSNPYYGQTIEAMTQNLENIREQIEATDITDPAAFWEQVRPALQHSSFTQCALDMATNDLYAKKLGKPLYQLWDLNPKDAPISNYTIGIDSIEKMVQKLKEQPWPIYKIKLGTKEDIEIVRELRKHTDAVFRVDANCAWGVDETINNAVELQKLGVEFIEQPMKADNLEGMKEVYKHSVLPLIADESCIVEADVAKCHNLFHGVNIKLTKCGGVTPAIRMINKARELGLKVMIGCMTESSVGISAIGHLAPMLDYVDMDGALLLKEDIATGVVVKETGLIYPQENGTGAQLLPQLIEA